MAEKSFTNYFLTVLKLRLFRISWLIIFSAKVKFQTPQRFDSWPHQILCNDSFFSEQSLNQSRNPKIKNMCRKLDQLVAKIHGDFLEKNKEIKEEMEETLRIILSVKKVKADLHIRYVEP